MRRLGRFVGTVSDSLARSIATTLTCAVVFGVGEYLVERLILQANLSPALHAFVDACLFGGGCAVLVWIILLGDRVRRKRVLAELERLAELNHTLRNSLQVIVSSEFFPQDQRKQVVIEHVDRIERMLRRLFPAVGGKITPVQKFKKGSGR